MLPIRRALLGHMLIIVFQHLCCFRTGAMFPWVFPSTSITGPKAQQPRQLTVWRLNFRSRSVSPGLMPGGLLHRVEDTRRAAHVTGSAHTDMNS